MIQRIHPRRSAPRSRRIWGVALSLGLLIGTTGCFCINFNGERDKQLKQLRSKDSALRGERIRLTKAKVDYERIANRTTQPLVVSTAKSGDLQRAVKSTLPFSFSAKKLNSLVSGKITITSISGVKITGSKVNLRVSGKGRGLKVNHAGAAYTKLDDEIIAGLKAGITMDLEGRLDINGKGDLVWIGKVGRVKLKKHNKHAGRIKGAVNDHAFNRPHTVDISDLVQAGKKMKLSGVMTTTDTIVMGFM